MEPHASQVIKPRSVDRFILISSRGGLSGQRIAFNGFAGSRILNLRESSSINTIRQCYKFTGLSGLSEVGSIISNTFVVS